MMLRTADLWDPVGTELRSAMTPDVGEVIALERGAWEIVSVGRIPPAADDAPAQTGVVLRRLYGPRLEVEGSGRSAGLLCAVDERDAEPRDWHVYRSGRVPLASCCGHPWPCRCIQDAATVERQLAALEHQLAAALPGMCAGCGEPITTRQRSVTMPGPYLDYPAEGSPTFHLRGRCSSARESYLRRLLAQLHDTFNNDATDSEGTPDHDDD